MLSVVVNVASLEDIVEDFLGVLSLSQLNLLSVGHRGGCGGDHRCQQHVGEGVRKKHVVMCG